MDVTDMMSTVRRTKGTLLCAFLLLATILAMPNSSDADTISPRIFVDSFAGVVQTSPITITGTATDTGGIDEVFVAIRRNGDKFWLQADGTLAASYYRRSAELADKGAPATSWEITLPVPTGSYLVFVKAWDTSGNSNFAAVTQLLVSSTGLPDDISPEITLTSPLDQSSVGSAVIFTGTMTDDVAIDRGYVAIQKFPDKAWLQADGAFSSFARLPVDLASPGQPTSEWSLTANLPIGFYRLFVIAVDSFGNEHNERSEFWVRTENSDVDNPVATIEAPTGEVPFFNPVRLAGTASDTGGVAFVGVTVQRVSDGQWLGFAGRLSEFFYEFEATLEQPGGSETAWEIIADMPVGDYRMRVRVFDKAGNQNVQPTIRMFSATTNGVDSSDPTVSFISPSIDETVTGPTVNVRGIARDNLAIRDVFIAVNRVSDGLWLRADGTFGEYQRRKANFEPGQTRWDLAVSLLKGDYRLHALAIDTSGNKTNATRTFRMDSAPIGVKFFEPQDGSGELSSPVTFTGEANAPTGIGDISIAIKRITGRAWLQLDGSWGSDYTRLPVNIDNPGAVISNWSAVFDLDRGVYRAHVIVTSNTNETDNSNILIAVERPVRSDQPPNIQLLTPSHRAVVGSSFDISGIASDDTSIDVVYVAIKRITGRAWLQKDGSWGDDFAQLPVNVEAAGTPLSNWSQGFKLDKGIYRVHAIAIDNSGKRTIDSATARFGVERPAY